MKKIILMATAIAGLLYACGDGYKTSEDGLKYKIHVDKEGELVKLGDYVTLNMSYRTDSDSVLFDTYQAGNTVRLVVDAPTFKGDLMNGLMLLSEGDSATFLINADSLFQKTFGFDRPEFIAAGSFLTFDVKVEKAVNKVQMEEEMRVENEKHAAIEKLDIDKYISDNNLTTVSTGTGLQYVITKAGNGGKAQAGDIVVVHYEGKLLNGNKFDSSYDMDRPFEFPVGQGQVIKGWDEAFMVLEKGSKATLIIPSPLAYGANAVGGGAIPAHSPLVFTVELIDIKKSAN